VVKPALGIWHRPADGDVEGLAMRWPMVQESPKAA
jgi:hypothetical protein